MTPNRRAELLVLRDMCVVFGEADVPAKIVAPLITELVAWCDFVTRANEDLANIEEKLDNARTQARELFNEAAKLKDELAEAKKENDERAAIHDRHVLELMDLREQLRKARGLPEEAPPF